MEHLQEQGVLGGLTGCHDLQQVVLRTWNICRNKVSWGLTGCHDLQQVVFRTWDICRNKVSWGSDRVS